MRSVSASRDPGRYAVDYGHEIEVQPCGDEGGFDAQFVLAGVRRAEDERRSDPIADVSDDQETIIPSEIFFG